jgi:hypothetical protein
MDGSKGIVAAIASSTSGRSCRQRQFQPQIQSRCRPTATERAAAGTGGEGTGQPHGAAGAVGGAWCHDREQPAILKLSPGRRGGHIEGGSTQSVFRE